MLFSPVPLHIPDGFLTLAISLIFWGLTVVAVGMAISKTNKTLGEKQVPLMGIMAAFIFAAQMLNFPVAGGTSGHFLGGALAAIVLGPWAAILVMTAVVGLQGLLFQDGGLLVMGANIFNMGVLTAMIGFGLYRSVLNANKITRLAVAGAGAWLSTMAAALLTSLQLWLSGTSSLQIVIPAMLGVHAIIGLGEAIITVAALAFILQARPDLLDSQAVAEKGGRGWIYAGVLISILAVLLSPFASANPDGLERIAEDVGFLERGLAAPYQILPDYTIPFLGETALSTVVAGIVGALVVLGMIVLLGSLLKKKEA
ncbi:MAG: energy-coupling factor ABC transporter permease [Anaerolineales bacterium]|jgi:cobalt/nickel transport system permease protein|nr:energy-coupling factor ABC transporter permease [Anaerolineales bacterium]